jgi:RNA polymerase sigma-70 factor (ECF subfamily)
MGYDELQIIRDCQEGSEAAFEALVEQYKERAYWIAYDLVGNREAAKDISQDAFVRVFQKIRTFDPRNSFAGWLSRIVVNLAIDHLRARRRQATVSLDELPMEPGDPKRKPSRLESEEERALVRKALDRLPEKYRAVLILKEINGMSSEEIAQALGSPAITIRWRLHTARKMFKDVWERVGRK